MKKTNRMRKSQETIFWRNHRIVELRLRGKTIGWYGVRFPKTAQEIRKEVNEDE